MSFVFEIAKKHNIAQDHLLVQYLERKTQAVDRGSKARRSLGNLYALLVLSEDYVEKRTSRFTDLLRRMKELPFGSKLQNHPLDNRLNDEFRRQTNVDSHLLPVQAVASSDQKSREISEELLEHGNSNPISVASFVVEAIRTYIELITERQSSILDEIEEIQTHEELIEFLETAYHPKSDARFFEVASFVVLAAHFASKSVFYGETEESISEHKLSLFKTGRTNANDGGIDFVLQPIGRFFQVTETLDFRKYFLDFDKVNRFKISFVIKYEGDGASALQKIQADAQKSAIFSTDILSRYMNLFDEVITSQDLLKIAKLLPESSIDQIRDQLILQFKLEYGLLD